MAAKTVKSAVIRNVSGRGGIKYTVRLETWKQRNGKGKLVPVVRIVTRADRNQAVSGVPVGGQFHGATNYKGSVVNSQLNK